LPGPNGSAPSYLRSVSYNNAGQVTGDIVGGTQCSWGYTGGVTEQFGYDANRMQMTSQRAGTASPYTNRMGLTYNYSASAGQMGSGSTAGNAGQLMSVSGTIGGVPESAAYTYDNLGRIVTSNQTTNTVSAQRRFAYDRWGNRTGMWDAVSGGIRFNRSRFSNRGCSYESDRKPHCGLDCGLRLRRSRQRDQRRRAQLPARQRRPHCERRRCASRPLRPDQQRHRQVAVVGGRPGSL
jgi:YD repeat-containing protein